MTQETNERGAVAVIVAVLLVILLGFAAIAVDVGMLYAEKAELRNGADAAAVGIAQTCAEDVAGPKCTDSVESSSLAKELADANALDSQSNASNVELDKTAGTVSVTTGALEAGGTPNSVSLFFARALGFNEAEVSVTSHAAWGSPSSGPAPFPIVFSECEVPEINTLQLVQYHGNNTGAGCLGGPPGGFGHLNSVAGECEALVNIDSAASGSNPGNGDISDECDTVLSSWAASINAGVHPLGLFPIYKAVSYSGNNATYDLSGFAAFEIYGWKLRQGASNKFPESFRADYYTGNECGETHCIGVIGRFVKHVSLDDAYDIAPGASDHGTDIVQLTLGETP